jgi:hypothetical protein
MKKALAFGEGLKTIRRSCAYVMSKTRRFASIGGYTLRT